MMTMFRTVRTGGLNVFYHEAGKPGFDHLAEVVDAALQEIGFTAAPAGLAMHGRRGRMPYRSS
jgi:hypothetical protein